MLLALDDAPAIVVISSAAEVALRQALGSKRKRLACSLDLVLDLGEARQQGVCLVDRGAPVELVNQGLVLLLLLCCSAARLLCCSAARLLLLLLLLISRLVLLAQACAGAQQHALALNEPQS